MAELERFHLGHGGKQPRDDPIGRARRGISRCRLPDMTLDESIDAKLLETGQFRHGLAQERGRGGDGLGGSLVGNARGHDEPEHFQFGRVPANGGELGKSHPIGPPGGRVAVVQVEHPQQRRGARPS